MAACKYCGKSAGIFSHSHKECEEKHNQGITILEGAMRSYYRNTTQIGELKNTDATIGWRRGLEDKYVACEGPEVIA